MNPKNLLFVLVLVLVAQRGRACGVELEVPDVVARNHAVVLYGPPGSFLGYAASAAGDLNADGFDDVVVVGPLGDEAAVFIVFGRSAADWANASEFLHLGAEAAGAAENGRWVRVFSETANDRLGERGITHGDFNGDGIEDLLIGSLNSLRAFVFWGHAGSWDASLSTANVSGATGFTIKAAQAFGSSMSVGNAGDMNGDGIEDMFVSEKSSTGASAAFVIFGVPGATRSLFELSSIDGTNGFSLTDGSETVGYGAMGSVGDVDGDGLADLAFGSYSANSNGRAYVLFARNYSSEPPWPSVLDINTTLDGMNGFLVDGSQPSDSLGFTVMGAGDANGDGFADIFIGTESTTVGAWVLFGHRRPWTASLRASQIGDGDGEGFHFVGTGTSFDYWGRTGGCAGDVNGDGVDDVVIGGYNAKNMDGVTTGEAAIIFGHSGKWPSEIKFSNVVGSAGFLVEGPAYGSQLGFSARGAGDVNGDGIADFIFGIPRVNSSAGAAALFFGFDDHCEVCSNITDSCLVCEPGFYLDETICEFGTPPALESSSLSQQSSSSSSSSSLSQQASASSSLLATNSLHSSSSAPASVVVIETGGGSASEVAAEVAQLLGVDVGQISVIEITPGTFEVTVINEEVAQQLVNLVEFCMEGEQQ